MIARMDRLRLLAAPHPTKSLTPVRVVCIGLGAIGGGVARVLLDREGYEIVGAMEPQPRNAVDGALANGRLGVPVACDRRDLDRVKADICVICTNTHFEQVRPDIRWALEQGMNVLTSAEEKLPYPWFAYADEAAEVDALAKRNGVTALATGINPGFAMDALVILLTAACSRIRRIDVHRANDLSSFGKSVMKSFGIGLTPEAFDAGLESGTVVGHTGFVESISMICGATGLQVDEIRTGTRPIIAAKPRRAPFAAAEPGQVAGAVDTAEGLCDGEVVIRLEHPQQIDPAAEQIGTVDRIAIDGDPPIAMTIEPEIAGAAGTIALLANMIPSVIEAPPGLTTMDRLRLPAGVFG
jgi:4-hydroxy-tetrahydrodipicolinate reductase